MQREQMPSEPICESVQSHKHADTTKGTDVTCQRKRQRTLVPQFGAQLAVDIVQRECLAVLPVASVEHRALKVHTPEGDEVRLEGGASFRPLRHEARTITLGDDN